MISFNDVVDFFLQLEGPYRWYVIGTILVVMTAVITRFIFKTIKWFLMIMLLGVIILAIVHVFSSIDLLAMWRDLR